jgi:hypothetical protein
MTKMIVLLVMASLGGFVYAAKPKTAMPVIADAKLLEIDGKIFPKDSFPESCKDLFKGAKCGAESFGHYHTESVKQGDQVYSKATFTGPEGVQVIEVSWEKDGKVIKAICWVLDAHHPSEGTVPMPRGGNNLLDGRETPGPVLLRRWHGIQANLVLFLATSCTPEGSHHDSSLWGQVAKVFVRAGLTIAVAAAATIISVGILGIIRVLLELASLLLLPILLLLLPRGWNGRVPSRASARNTS